MMVNSDAIVPPNVFVAPELTYHVPLPLEPTRQEMVMVAVDPGAYTTRWAAEYGRFAVAQYVAAEPMFVVPANIAMICVRAAVA